MGNYAGDITAEKVWELLSQEGNATLVDVRTPEEWQQVGTPDLSPVNKSPILLSWKTNPGYVKNENFLPEFEAKNIDKDSKIFFLCKGGGRSREAAIAATASGYKNAYNVVSGFEGEGGWKSSNLPFAFGQNPSFENNTCDSKLPKVGGAK